MCVCALLIHVCKVYTRWIQIEVQITTVFFVLPDNSLHPPGVPGLKQSLIGGAEWEKKAVELASKSRFYEGYILYICICVYVCISYHPDITIFLSSPAKPRTSLRQPDHRGRGVGRGGGSGGGGGGRSGGQHDFRQGRDMRDTQSEGKTNQSSNQNKPTHPNTTTTRRSSVPSERWVVIGGNHRLDWLDYTFNSNHDWN